MKIFPSNDTPVISVVIPTYNRANSITKCLNSVLQQTYSDLEALIVDDGSTDNTKSIISGYDDKRITYISHEENRGVSAARNTGIEESKGDYIAFLDSDDWWDPQKLERQLNELEQTDASVIYSDYYDLREGSIAYARTPKIIDPDSHYIDIFNAHLQPSTSTLVIDKQCLRDVRFDETLQIGEDFHFMVRLFKQCYPAKINEPLAFRRYSEDSLSRKDAALVYKHHSRAVTDLVKRIPELKQYSNKKQSADYWKFSFVFANEGKLSEARRMAKKSISFQPIALTTLPAYLLLFSYYLPLGPYRECLLQAGQNVYLKTIRK